MFWPASLPNENLIVPNSYIMVTNPVIPNADQKIIRLQNSSKVSPRKVGINWSRRDVTIADQTGSVVCKLWNTFDTLLDESNRSGEVRLNNLEVDKWGQDTSLKTTQETELQAISNTEQNVLVEVLAQHGQQLLLVKPGSDDAEEVNVGLDVDIPDFNFSAVATVDINNGIISAFH
ncbi:uncharacterized protein LOC135482660 [Lineus longissimus]|uniref:uncharacterized protein LOC135482660 n=1 Tax=Lineus longissimus TaxID=88925 RepID=UPI002B4EECBA